MGLVVQVIVFLMYISLLLELTVFHVPSVASSLNIWNPNDDLLKYYSEKYSKIFTMSKWKKFCLFILPLGVIYVTYFFPSFLYFDTPLDLALIFTPTTLVLVLGILLMLIGRYITFSSVLTIRNQNEQKEDSFMLHTEGGFSKIRNPGLVGLYIFLIGIWFVIPSAYFLVGIIFYMCYMHFKVLMEEDFLTNRFGKSYEQYFTNTKRYF